MKEKKLPGVNIIASIIIIIHMLPIYITVIASLTNITDLKSYLKPPSYLYLENYKEALTSGDMLIAFKNTAFITVISVTLVILLGSLAAFPLARNKTKLNNGISLGIMSVMMIPPLSLLVPLYSFMKTLNAINSIPGIILLHVVFQLPLSIFLFKNFISAIPKELDEAATIDGCGVIQVFFRIILPNIKPVVATVIILTGVSIWNDYQFSLYFLQSNDLKVMTLSISSFFSQGDMNLNVAASAAIIGIIPLTIAFLSLQKYFIKGMIDSAIK